VKTKKTKREILQGIKLGLPMESTENLWRRIEINVKANDALWPENEL
jgi:hypothetical protein